MKKILKNIVRKYLRFLTRAALLRHRPEIIAIAGTAGKTRTKEAVMEVFPKEESVRANPKSYNTEIGLPLAVLYLPSGHSSFLKWLKVLAKGTAIAFFGRNFPKKLVLELGVDRPEDMNYLLTMVRPKIAVITEITPAYLENFKTLERTADEYKKLIKELPEGGAAILNYDDLRVRELAKYNKKAKCLYYGTKEGADIRAMNIKDISGGQEFDIEYGDRRKHCKIVQRGCSHIYACLAAFAVREISKKDK